MTQTLLLTGATGFLGGHVLRLANDAGYRVVVLKRPTSAVSHLTSLYRNATFVDAAAAELAQLFSDHAVDIVVHLACDQGRGANDLEALLRTNVLLGIQLLQAAKTSGVKRFLNADTQLEAEVNAYARSKKQFAQWLPTFASSLHITNMRLGNIYGPGESSTGFLSWLIEEFRTQPASIDFTPGEQLRDFVHVADVASAIMAMVETRLSTGLHSYDVGSGQLNSLRNFVELARDVYEQECGGIRSTLNFGGLPYREGEVMVPAFDTSRLLALGWRPGYTLESGLRNTLRGL